MMLSACQNAGSMADVTRLIEPELTEVQAEPPPGARPGSCWGRDVTPAIIETVTEQVMMQPAQITASGEVISPALYKTETQQRIVRERQEIWFETPCERQTGPGFYASLQRALKARGYYNGPITDAYDHSTRRAVRKYQKAQGLDSAILSMAAARQLGLVLYQPVDG